MKQFLFSKSSCIFKSLIKQITGKIEQPFRFIDELFFLQEDKESQEIRPYFYRALVFGLGAVLVVIH